VEAQSSWRLLPLCLPPSALDRLIAVPGATVEPSSAQNIAVFVITAHADQLAAGGPIGPDQKRSPTKFSAAAENGGISAVISV